MRTEIDNTQDILDSRDIIARIAELESERETLAEAVTDAKDSLEAIAGDTSDENQEGLTEALEDARETLADWDTENGEELKALQSLAEEGEGSPDWQHGESLIRDTYFEDYARQLAEDIGAISGDEKWPLTCLDWEKAADELKQDYFTVDFGGEVYWIRA